MAKAIRTSGNYLVIETKQGKLRIIDGWKDVPKTASRLAAFALKSDAEQFVKRDNCPLDDPRIKATILAALRARQSPRTWRETEDIASDGGTIVPLSAAEIDILCERINP